MQDVPCVSHQVPRGKKPGTTLFMVITEMQAGKIPKGIQKEMEESHDKIHMGDKQYIELLEKIVQKVNEPGFKPKFYDETTIGSKETWSNCGLCNDSDYNEESTWTTNENAAFPDQLPGRRTFKYFEEYQQCPFDWRKNPGINGCFHTCYLFKNKPSSINIDSLKRMATKRLQEKKEELKESIEDKKVEETCQKEP